MDFLIKQISDLDMAFCSVSNNQVFRIAILTTHPLSQMFSDDQCAALKDERQFNIYDGHYSAGRIDDALSGKKIDLVIARVDGVNSLQRVSKIIHNGSGQKVIIIGDHATEVIFEYIKAGIKGHLSRSISPDLLIKAIRVVHNGEVWFDRNTSSKVLELFAVREAEKRMNIKINRLTARENAVLECVSRGLKNREIASSLFISESTVKTHLYNIYDKLGVSDRLAAALLMRDI